MKLGLGPAIKDLRHRLGLSQRRAANQLGISYVHLCNVENGHSQPSFELLEKFHDAWGIDVYMYALVYFPGERLEPRALQKPLRALKAFWKRHIERVLRERALGN